MGFHGKSCVFFMRAMGQQMVSIESPGLVRRVSVHENDTKTIPLQSRVVPIRWIAQSLRAAPVKDPRIYVIATRLIVCLIVVVFQIRGNLCVALDKANRFNNSKVYRFRHNNDTELTYIKTLYKNDTEPKLKRYHSEKRN